LKVHLCNVIKEITSTPGAVERITRCMTGVIDVSKAGKSIDKIISNIYKLMDIFIINFLDDTQKSSETVAPQHFKKGPHNHGAKPSSQPPKKTGPHVMHLNPHYRPSDNNSEEAVEDKPAYYKSGEPLPLRPVGMYILCF
jgi:hypothetical protein